MPPKITEAGKDDCERVAKLATKTFIDNFGYLYRPENLARHLADKCSTKYFVASLAAGDTLLMLHLDDTLIGYAKVGHVGLPVKPVERKSAQEIHRVYVEKEHQGKGFGKAMMIHILSLPRIATASTVFLGVWEENLRAQQLYKQYAFEPVGRYLYQVGDQHDREIIMARCK